MIHFLKRHVWPWAEIERLRARETLLGQCLIVTEAGRRKLRDRLAKYERPRDENGRFTSNG